MKQHIKKLAISIATKNGLINLSRRELCLQSGIPEGSFVLVMGISFTEFVNQLKHEGVGEGDFKVDKNRVNPELRSQQILNTALKIAAEVNYDNITNKMIADAAGISTGLVVRYYATIKQLKRSIMRAAVHQEVLSVIAQGLVNNDPHALKAPLKIKKLAIKSIQIQ